MTIDFLLNCKFSTWKFIEKSAVILWVSWCKNKSFWQRFTCTAMNWLSLQTNYCLQIQTTDRLLKIALMNPNSFDGKQETENRKKKLSQWLFSYHDICAPLNHLHHCIYVYILLKFIYSEKAKKFCEIFTLLLSYVVPVKSEGEISKCCGLLRIYEL